MLCLTEYARESLTKKEKKDKRKGLINKLFNKTEPLKIEYHKGQLYKISTFI